MTKPLLCLCLALPPLYAGAAQIDLLHKPDEPVTASVTDDPKLPRVLLIGDSISVGYTLPARKLLAGRANVHRIPANGGSTANGLAHLDEWLGTSRWDVIHFNWGLHDLKLNSNGTHFVPLAQYETNLVALTRRLQATGAALIWASTTPVPKGRLSPPRQPGDEARFNDAARRVMERQGVAINDLHTYISTQPRKLQRAANVHFTPEGSAALARQVADSIQSALKNRPARRETAPR